jgi:hypothetical protein
MFPRSKKKDISGFVHLKRRSGVPITCIAIKYTAWKLAKSHTTISCPAQVVCAYDAKKLVVFLEGFGSGRNCRQTLSSSLLLFSSV